MQINKKWVLILLSYALLLIGMGYIAFFHLKYNPVTQIGDNHLKLLSNENSKELIETAFMEESKAFQMKRDLAIQSFNIVLGAALGFLSATATMVRKKSKNNNQKQEQANQKEGELI